jgi:hypothetical protein
MAGQPITSRNEHRQFLKRNKLVEMGDGKPKSAWDTFDGTTGTTGIHAMAAAPPGTQRLELPDADHHVMIDQPLALAAMLADLVPTRDGRHCRACSSWSTRSRYLVSIPTSPTRWSRSAGWGARWA